MVTLSENTTKRFYFVKDNVIFNISYTNPSEDSCAKEIGGGKHDDSIPFITVKKEGEDDKKFYLDVLVQDGDTCTPNGEEFTFKHTVHSKNEGDETEGKFSDYYLQLCNEQIVEAIKGNLKKDYEYFTSNLNRLGIPLWMLQGQDYTIENSEGSGDFAQVNFTEEMYDGIKSNEVMKLSLDAANKKAGDYSYKVLNETLEMQKITQ